jgi:hypothetical protein
MNIIRIGRKRRVQKPKGRDEGRETAHVEGGEDCECLSEERVRSLFDAFLGECMRLLFD